jgi:Uma2 family endonuclease
VEIVIMLDAVQTRMSVREYEQLPETNHIQELIDGELVMAGGPNIEHQRTVRRTYNYVEKIVPGGEVFFAPTGIFLDDHNIPEPDVIWLAPDSRYHAGSQYIMGGADLVIEVLSPGNAKYDRIRKFALYERFGIPEYWMLEPDERLAEVWVLQEGRYQRQGAYQPGDTFQSPALHGATVTVAALFEDATP